MSTDDVNLRKDTLRSVANSDINCLKRTSGGDKTMFIGQGRDMGTAGAGEQKRAKR
jgi:hypothetical protein